MNDQGGRAGVRLLMLALLVAAWWVVPQASAQEETAQPGEGRAEAVRGRLRAAGEPVAGARIIVRRGEQVVVRATSDGSGEWEARLPGPGTYVVELDEESLPEDVDLRSDDRGRLEVSVRPGQRRTLIFPLGEGAGGGSDLIRRLAQASLNGIKFGLIIAMTAIGLSLVYGTTQMVNFAHGDMVTFGAVIALFLNTSGPRLQLIPAAIGAIAVGGLMGAGLERGLWRPLRARRTGLIQLLVISIGLALVLRHVILLWFGGRPRPYVDYTVQGPLRLGPIVTTPRDLSVILLSAVVLVAVGFLLLRTRLGKAMRAVADNRDLAESSGIDVQRVILWVWVLSGALAALGGVFLGVVENVEWLMGFRALLLMFAAVILGGLGTAFGAMAGGLLVGLATEISTIFQPSELKMMWALIAMIIVLLIRPQGIFGRRERIG